MRTDLRIEQGGLGVKCYALSNELSICYCEEDICIHYIHESHFKGLSIGVFILTMSTLRAMYICYKLKN